MPPIKFSTTNRQGIGRQKTNTLKDGGGKVHLQLEYYEPKIRGDDYVVRSSPLPLNDYVGEVRVKDLGDGRAQLTWRGVFGGKGVDQPKADGFLSGFYEAVAVGIGKEFPRE
ncbi:MAG: SRPBCC family protein [Hyphomicrobiaceae bacterium]